MKDCALVLSSDPWAGIGEGDPYATASRLLVPVASVRNPNPDFPSAPNGIDRVADQVGEYLPQLRGISVDGALDLVVAFNFNVSLHQLRLVKLQHIVHNF